ncbi:MAG: DinB family protein [Gemmatimonadaceae bacterium]|nr:DinB family protein [Gemmatimonadaceae bacterium]
MTSTRLDRARALLRDAHQHLLAAVGGLSAEQWSWRPTDQQWSVLDNVEHLAVVERGTVRFLTDGFTHPEAEAAPARPIEALDAYDQKIIAWMLSRNERRNAPERVNPKGRFTSGQEALDNLTTSRQSIIAFADAPTYALEAHLAPHPAVGKIDGIQWLLFLGGHMERHVRQIEEIVAHPAFGK